MNLGSLTPALKLSLGGIVAVIVGSCLPWISLLGITVFGIQGDGIITISFAVIGAIILVLSTGLFRTERRPGYKSQIALAVLAALTLLICVIHIRSVAAFGLYLTLLGALAWVGGAVWQFTLMRDGAPATASRPQDQFWPGQAIPQQQWQGQPAPQQPWGQAPAGSGQQTQQQWQAQQPQQNWQGQAPQSPQPQQWQGHQPSAPQQWQGQPPAQHQPAAQSQPPHQPQSPPQPPQVQGEQAPPPPPAGEQR